MTERKHEPKQGHFLKTNNSGAVVDPVRSVVPYDENLLERARTQWQFGDWKSLVQLSRENLQNHPDRAKLILLAAAGRLQTGNYTDARQYVRLAQDWGASKKLVSQILIAGVHNSLGRAAAIGKHQYRALQHFENAITIGTPGSDTNLLTQARINEQLNQLSLATHGEYVAVNAGATESMKEVETLFSEASGKTSNEEYAHFSSSQYWEARYQNGGTSGYGSYGRLAEFKAKIINKFIDDEGIDSVIEFGCGDGNQLSMFRIKNYVGVDVSQTIVDQCREKFKDDTGKLFLTTTEFERSRHKANLTLSLDVIFHLIEENVFTDYMKTLFRSAERFCIIYACNEEANDKDSSHVKRRKFTEWVEKNVPEWELSSVIYNPYPFLKFKSSKISSFSDFYFFVNTGNVR